ncbi:co-chaperone GroES [Gluconacetobacter diazotrophicus]|nr:co-chaperone GroES [Gluconacetobacter diazotrophicus]
MSAAEAEGPDSGPDAALVERLRRWIDSPNIAEELDDAVRGRVADRVARDWRADDASRAEWKEQYRRWLDVAQQVSEPKTYPWPGASNVIYPLLTIAAVQFAARAYPGIVRDRDVVRGTVVGDDSGVPAPPLAVAAGGPAWLVPPGAKRTRANAIGRHMSWQLLNEMEDWEEQTDKLLLKLSIVGTMFRKTYFDPGLQRNVSETVDPLRLCIDYNAKSFAAAPRITEEIDLYPWEVEEKIRAGLFLDDEYGCNHDAGDDEDAPVTFLEQHRRYDLDGDGYAEPYIVTIARDSGRLARIVAGFESEGVIFGAADHRIRRIDAVAYYTKFPFIPSPDSAIYDIGFGTLLHPLNAAVNTSLNQMFDAAHLANAGGGFIGSGMSLNSGSVRFQIGEYKVVNTPGATLRENLVPMQFSGPNPVLFQLLGFLVDAGREIASVKDILSGAMPGGNVPGVLGLAVIQQGLKVFSAIFKRIHRSLGMEFRKLYRLNRIYLPDEAGFRAGAEYFRVTRADYEQGSGVEPVSDPEVVTDMQQLARANFLLSFKDDPWCDGHEIRRRAFEAAAIGDIDQVLRAQPAPDLAAIGQAAEVQRRARRDAREMEIRADQQKVQQVSTLADAILHLAQARRVEGETGGNGAGGNGEGDGELAWLERQGFGTGWGGRAWTTRRSAALEAARARRLEVLGDLGEDSFRAWRHHPVSRAVLRFLEDYRDSVEQRMLGQWRAGTANPGAGARGARPRRRRGRDRGAAMGRDGGILWWGRRVMREGRILKFDQQEYVMSDWDGVNRAGYVPLDDKILVLADVHADMTSGAVQLPAEYVERQTLAAEHGTVIAVGPAAFRWNDDGTRQWVGQVPAPGDRVYFERYAGQLLKGEDGLLYRLMSQRCIAAIGTAADGKGEGA